MLPRGIKRIVTAVSEVRKIRLIFITAEPVRR